MYFQLLLSGKTENYVEAQAVSDKNIVTANGVGHLEFTREMLLLGQS